MLLGQTLDGMRVWDVRRAIQTIRSIEGFARVPISVEGKGKMSVIALYAALFEPDISSVALSDLPRSHRDGPDFLNVLRILDLPTSVAMLAENSKVGLHGKNKGDWQYPVAIAKKFDFDLKFEPGGNDAGGE